MRSAKPQQEKSSSSHEELLKFGSVYGADMQLLPDGTVSKPLGVYEVKGDALVLIGRIVEGKIEAK